MKLTYTMLPLIILMALTRVHHFGDSFNLPDASLAVFFLAGLFFNSRLFLGLLLVEAGLMDYVAIHHFAVSDWCISPAYLFLIPTYAVLWFAGRYCAAFNITNMQNIARIAIMLVLATSAAFMISNISFYLFSGRYENMALTDYSLAVINYYLPYLSSAIIYSALVLASYFIIQVITKTQVKTRSI